MKKQPLLEHPLIIFLVACLRRRGTEPVSIYNNYILKLRTFFVWLINVYPMFNQAGLDNLIVANVTTEHLKAYKSYLVGQVRKGNLTPNGAKRNLQYVKGAFGILYQKNKIPNDIRRFVTNIEADDYKYRDIPDENEFQKFFDLVALHAVNPQEEIVAFLLMLDVGLRSSEVVALRWADVNITNGTIALNETKGENSLIPLPDVVIKELTVFFENEGQPAVDQRIFSRKTPLSFKNYLYHMFKIYCLVAGISVEGGSHLLRHAFVTRLSDTNCTPGQLAFLSRHKNLGSLRLYLHFSEEKLRSEINKLNFKEDLNAQEE